jgi:hypothetical protein
MLKIHKSRHVKTLDAQKLNLLSYLCQVIYKPKLSLIQTEDRDIQVS